MLGSLWKFICIDVNDNFDNWCEAGPSVSPFFKIKNLTKHQFLISWPSHKYHVSMCDFSFCELNWMKSNAFSFIYTHQICETLPPKTQGCNKNWCWKQLTIAAHTMQHPSTCGWIQACKYAKRIVVTGSFVLWFKPINVVVTAMTFVR